MDLGWITTLADGATGQQLSRMTRDRSAAINPSVSVEVGDVDRVYAAAERHGADAARSTQDEAWGVRRFFVRDAAGDVIKVLAHRR